MPRTFIMLSAFVASVDSPRSARSARYPLPVRVFRTTAGVNGNAVKMLPVTGYPSLPPPGSLLYFLTACSVTEACRAHMSGLQASVSPGLPLPLPLPLFLFLLASPSATCAGFRPKTSDATEISAKRMPTNEANDSFPMMRQCFTFHPSIRPVPVPAPLHSLAPVSFAVIVEVCRQKFA